MVATTSREKWTYPHPNNLHDDPPKVHAVCMSYNYKTWTKLEPKKANIDQKYRWLQYPIVFQIPPEVFWVGFWGPNTSSQDLTRFGSPGVGSRVVHKYLHFQIWPFPTSMLNWPSFLCLIANPPRKTKHKKKTGGCDAECMIFVRNRNGLQQQLHWAPDWMIPTEPWTIWPYCRYAKMQIYNVPWAPKTMKNKGFGHLKTWLSNTKTSNNVGLGCPWSTCMKDFLHKHVRVSWGMFQRYVGDSMDPNLIARRKKLGTSAAE